MGIKSAIRKLGLDVRRTGLGQDPFEDIARFIGSQPVIFDVGANRGQTIDEVSRRFPGCTIHAFEPGQAAFASLSKTHRRDRVRLNNVALGAAPARREFFEHSASDMSSFLELGQDARNHIAGDVSSKLEVEIQTVDRYCFENGIDRIDLLKSDTQGFDLEVLKGAQRMLREGHVQMIYLEITFAKLYEQLPRPDDVYRFIVDHGFDLVSFYKFWHLNDRAGWTDALFVERD